MVARTAAISILYKWFDLAIESGVRAFAIVLERAAGQPATIRL
jgi:hypothetical protein